MHWSVDVQKQCLKEMEELREGRCEISLTLGHIVS